MNWDEALQIANAKRVAQGRLKRRMAEGKITAIAVLLGLPPCLSLNSTGQGKSLREVLVWQPRWGQARVDRFLRRYSWTTLAGRPVASLPLKLRRRVAADLAEDYERTQRGRKKAHA